ncbi:hypothetical protein [Amycolatopsis japonica]
MTRRAQAVKLGTAVDFTRQTRPPGSSELSDKAVEQLKRELFGWFTAALTLIDMTPEQLSKRTGIPADVLRGANAKKLLLAREPLSRILRLARFNAGQVHRAGRDVDEVLHALPKFPVWSQPPRTLPAEMMRIVTAQDLAETLAHAVDASGIPKKHLAEQAGLSRGHMYRLTSPDKKALPRKASQIRALLETCAVPEKQVVEILEQWHVLHLHRYRSPDTTSTADLVDEPANPDPIEDTASAAADKPSDRTMPSSTASRHHVLGYAASTLTIGIMCACVALGWVSASWGVMIVLLIAITTAWVGSGRNPFHRRKVPHAPAPRE